MANLCIIDEAIGETRAAVMSKKKPIEYYIHRWSDAGVPRAGDVFAGRVKSIDKSLMAAFIDLGAGAPGLLRFTMAPDAPHITEGQMLRVKILREAEPGKGPLLGYLDVSEATAPAREKAVSLQETITARYPHIKFEMGVVDGIEWAAETEVALTGGGFIYIEHTRAGTMIDIDTAGGQKTKVSIAAAKEIARQVRLRGIGGLVLVDFPNFRKKKDRADVWQTMKDCMEGDPNTIKLAPFSRFDTVEFTRARFGLTLSQILLGDDGEQSTETTALLGLRRLLKEARVDGGAKLVLELQQAAYDWLEADKIDWRGPLADKMGARFTLKPGAKLDVYKDGK